MAVTEGNDGITKMTITCLRVGGAAGKVSRNYATNDAPQKKSINYPNFPCARSWRGDFESTQGILTWADGDMTPKTFDINVLGNTKPDYDKYISVHYNITEGGATVQHPESFHNYILNDDGK